MTIKPIHGAFGKNPPCILTGPIGRRIFDERDVAIDQAKALSKAIGCSRLNCSIDETTCEFKEEFIDQDSEENYRSIVITTTVTIP